MSNSFQDTIKRFFLGSNTTIGYTSGDDFGSLVPALSNAGVAVTEESAMTFSTVFACINIISDTIASLPLQVQKVTRSGKIAAKTHSIYELIHANPSELYTSYTFRYVIASHLLKRGNAYALIIRDKSETITSFQILDPTKVVVKISDSGDIFYVLGKNTYQSTDILHFKILSDNGIIGKSPLSFARENIGLGLAAEKFGQNYFGQGANIKGVIEVPANQRNEQKQQIKNSLNENYKGVSKSHGLMILNSGSKYHNVSIPLEDSQFIQTRKFQLLEIARIFRVPPHKLGELEKSSYSTNEQSEIAYLQDTIRPLLVNLEQEFNRKIWKVSEKGQYWVEHQLNGRLRGDVKTRASFYTTMKNLGAMTADEIRALENMNPLTKKQKQELALDAANVTLYGNQKDVNAIDNNNTDTSKEEDKNEEENNE